MTPFSASMTDRVRTGRQVARAGNLFLLNNGNAYGALACLFGIRNSFDFRPLAEGRGFPSDASAALRTEYATYGGPPDAHGTTWITWSELVAADWSETGRGPVWSVMRTLSELHGADPVRLVVWFH
ncbi:hypothetical protein [Streptomyces sp. NPDC090025]|uniref:hypothetical protein n=1 Tax=Streptomyces sp. NPDC090025 TaxID=3365922 RepID=UPI003839A458